MGVEGVILAAGLSSRFPEYKLTQVMEGKPLICHCVDNMLAFVDHIYVVTGHNAKLIESCLMTYENVECVYNEAYMDGMFSSVKSGLRHIHGERFFLMPGDHPVTSKETYQALLNTNGDVIIPSYNNRGGHPILMSNQMIDKILSSNSEHMRAFLENYNKVYVQVQDPYIRFDVDTKEALKELIRGKA